MVVIVIVYKVINRVISVKVFYWGVCCYRNK